jgi:Ca2+-binding RTX toxin-like protein
VGRTNSKGLLAGAVVLAALAFPGIANATVTSNVDDDHNLVVTGQADDGIRITCVGGWVSINDDDPTSGQAACADIKTLTVTGGDLANTINLAGVNGDYSQLTATTVSGGDGIDTITGSEKNDRLIGQKANDIVRGGPGNDTIVWNGGEGDDVNDGDAGTDTIEVNGNNTATIAETFTVKPSATPGRIRFDRAAPTPTPPGLFNLDIGTSEVLDLNMNGGDDTVTADAGLDALGFKLDVDGGDGADTIDGSDAADLLKGGPGNDTITPDDNPAGTFDDARGDAGNDTIIWNGGDDDDLNDGGEGDDTSRVNGAPAPETFTVDAGPAGHVIFNRTSQNPAPFKVDMTTTETLDLNMNGGDDTVTSNGAIAPFSLDVEGGDGADTIDGGDGADVLSGGNDNDSITPDDNPAGTLDVAHGDAGDDTITWNGGDDDDSNEGGDGNDTSVVNGAPAAERFTIKPSATPGHVRFDRTSQNPGPFFIEIGTTETLDMNANAGDDIIKGFAGVSGLIDTVLNGEDGDDIIRGTDSQDRINGGKGEDIVNSVDKAEDLLDCGPGFDLAFVDRRDFLRNCNVVLGGLLRVRVPQRTLIADHGTAALTLKCAGTKRCKGTARVRRNGKTLGSARFNITSGSKTVDLHLNGRGERLLATAPAKGYKASLQIDAKDARGNGWRSKTRVKLKG